MLEDFVRVIRAAIGNLTDPTPGPLYTIRFFKEVDAKGIDAAPLVSALGQVVESGKYKVIGEEAAKEISDLSHFSLPLVFKFLIAVGEHLDRGLLLTVTSRMWSGAIPLSVLFLAEAIPADPDAYLDQRFIDYLAAKGEDFDRVHWRNFERFYAEFFKRVGYVVELGPGTDDGGIDLRICPQEKLPPGPPLMVVQCRRYKRGKLVSIETVKALWTDVIFEGAERGLIATTSAVSPKGKRISEARKWPLSFAENTKVDQWARSMWRHA